jgi:CO/xanthine dehydrogenase FAD-binding subunit
MTESHWSSNKFENANVLRSGDFACMLSTLDYEIPKSLGEACDLLWHCKEKAKVIAGGTDLVIALRNGDSKPECLIDITQIPELQGIEEKEGVITIGAAVTHSSVASSRVVQRYGRVLSDAASEIGSPQIRNLGTIGGNIINASPAADTVPPLIVLNAIGMIASKEGTREVPVPGLFRGPYKTHLKSHEILVKIVFPILSPGMKTSFVRLARREAMAIARMSVAIILQTKNDQIEDIRVAVGAVTPAPQRMFEVEAILRGESFHEEILKRSSRKLSEEMIHSSGIRPSTCYKAPVLEALYGRALRKAFEEIE